MPAPNCGKVIDKLMSQTGPDFILTFGKHMGKKLKQIDPGYHNWLLQNTNEQRVKDNILLMRGGPSAPPQAPPLPNGADF